jgi:hypothetical protein
MDIESFFISVTNDLKEIVKRSGEKSPMFLGDLSAFLLRMITKCVVVMFGWVWLRLAENA